MNNIHSISQGTVSLTSPRNWALSALFVGASVFFTQLFLLLTTNFVVWLPFMLITLFVAYRYGWKMGMVTAIVSPALNYILFAEPGANTLSIVMFTGALIVGITALTAFWRRSH